MKYATSLNALAIHANRTSRTMEDTRQSVKNSNLPPRKKVELGSALNTFERIVGKPLRDVAEDLIIIRNLMAGASFVGIELSTWINIKSKVMRCLRMAGVMIMSGRCKTPCSPAWRALLDHIPGMPHRTQLTRLSRYCNERELEPPQVDQGVGDAFQNAMASQYPKKNHQKIYLNCINMWNRCVREFAAFWPQVPILPRYERDHYSYPEERFRKAFRDQAVGIVATAVKPPLGRMAGRPAIKESTAEKRYYTLFRVASIRARLLGVDPSEIRSVDELLDPPENLNAVIDFIAKRVSGRPDDELYLVKTGDLHNICRTMCGIAKYDLKFPKEKLDLLNNMRASVAPMPGAAESTMELFEHLHRPEVQEQFLLLPDIIINELRRQKRKTPVDVNMAQTAVLWAIMICAPMRSHNTVELREGETLLFPGSGRNRVARIVVPGDKTKNEVPLRFVVRPDVVRLIDIYMKEFLPHLKRDHGGRLCPGRDRLFKKPSQVSNELARLSANRLGIRMTAHKWRHAVGYIYLLHNPGVYEPVRRMLGHKSIKTTETFYAFMLAEDAQVAIDATFEEIRERGRQRLRHDNRTRRAA